MRKRTAGNNENTEIPGLLSPNRVFSSLRSMCAHTILDQVFSSGRNQSSLGFVGKAKNQAPPTCCGRHDLPTPASREHNPGLTNDCEMERDVGEQHRLSGQWPQGDVSPKPGEGAAVLPTGASWWQSCR